MRTQLECDVQRTTRIGLRWTIGSAVASWRGRSLLVAATVLLCLGSAAAAQDLGSLGTHDAESSAEPAPVVNPFAAQDRASVADAALGPKTSAAERLASGSTTPDAPPDLPASGADLAGFDSTEMPTDAAAEDAGPNPDRDKAFSELSKQTHGATDSVYQNGLSVDESSTTNPVQPTGGSEKANADNASGDAAPSAGHDALATLPSALDGSSPITLPGGIGGPKQWLSPEGISSALQMLLLLAVVSLAPAILLMTTCFVRIVVVLGLLRQAIGTQQLPSNQVMTSIALFMTLLVMSPVWSRVYHEALVPYSEHAITLEEAWDAGVQPVRQFMSAQIDRTGNRDDIWLFYEYLPESTPEPSSYDDVPLNVLLPAFMLSELKTAFLIGFQIYLPFLVLDLVVASVTISMGMMMLPPVLVSLPFKLLLFVLVDGWHLVVGMLLESFQTFT